MCMKDLGLREIVAGLIVTWVMVILSCCIFSKHEFTGYYLTGGKIWISINWEPDSSVCEYTEERWQFIVDNNLHVEIKKGENQ